MDHIINNWQEYISLGIVAIAFVLIVRSRITNKKNNQSCSNCSLAAMKNNIEYKPHRS